MEQSLLSILVLLFAFGIVLILGAVFEPETTSRSWVAQQTLDDALAAQRSRSDETAPVGSARWIGERPPK